MPATADRPPPAASQVALEGRVIGDAWTPAALSAPLRAALWGLRHGLLACAGPGLLPLVLRCLPAPAPRAALEQSVAFLLRRHAPLPPAVALQLLDASAFPGAPEARAAAVAALLRAPPTALPPLLPALARATAWDASLDAPLSAALVAAAVESPRGVALQLLWSWRAALPCPRLAPRALRLLRALLDASSELTTAEAALQVRRWEGRQECENKFTFTPVSRPHSADLCAEPACRRGAGRAHQCRGICVLCSSSSRWPLSLAHLRLWHAPRSSRRGPPAAGRGCPAAGHRHRAAAAHGPPPLLAAAPRRPLALLPCRSLRGPRTGCRGHAGDCRGREAATGTSRRCHGSAAQRRLGHGRGRRRGGRWLLNHDGGNGRLRGPPKRLGRRRHRGRRVSALRCARAARPLRRRRRHGAPAGQGG